MCIRVSVAGWDLVGRQVHVGRQSESLTLARDSQSSPVLRGQGSLELAAFITSTLPSPRILTGAESHFC